MKQVEKVSIGGYAYSMETVAAQSARQILGVCIRDAYIGL